MSGGEQRGGPDGSGEPDDGRNDRTANIILLAMAALFIGAGYWLIDALLTARKADECMSSGRRDCAQTRIVP